SALRRGNTDDEFKQMIEKPGFIWAHWDGTRATEDKIQEDTKATIRVIPFDGPKEPGTCVVTGKPSERRVVFARAYETSLLRRLFPGELGVAPALAQLAKVRDLFAAGLLVQGFGVWDERIDQGQAHVLQVLALVDWARLSDPVAGLFGLLHQPVQPVAHALQLGQVALGRVLQMDLL